MLVEGIVVLSVSVCMWVDKCVRVCVRALLTSSDQTIKWIFIKILRERDEEYHTLHLIPLLFFGIGILKLV